MIEKIISGGQIGADVAGLRAAKRFGLATGGWIPKGFRTLLGRMPELGREFGVKETDQWQYPPRTAMNVRDSDATMRFATNWNSPGELLTAKECIRQGKDHFDVTIGPDGTTDTTPEKAAQWAKENGIKTLNVAGNASEAIGPVVEAFVYAMLSILEES
jgi:hypothetical protein